MRRRIRKGFTVGMILCLPVGFHWLGSALLHLDWIDIVKSLAFTGWMAQGAYINVRLLREKPTPSLPSAGPYRDAAPLPPPEPKRFRPTAALFSIVYHMANWIIEPVQLPAPEIPQPPKVPSWSYDFSQPDTSTKLGPEGD